MMGMKLFDKGKKISKEEKASLQAAKKKAKAVKEKNG